ncbi:MULTISPECIES: NYN domain-containing protein [unclassified Halomonas]|uniref:LabA-like NYN domain-containing protein n=1 Tax=unclassified Halomonas TaxID=2609666 RepID=UPI0021E3A61F|nr:MULTISPECIES: NYN domain-containing protein [unclassified Halomonas]UYF99658.1 NYN domain-containing protein [Halomonas sp. GD1P12]WNL39251.1 NYN domain-containing protein [Halomonas sp. PAMB 3232]
MTRVALFVDTQNVYYTARDAFGKHFDYGAFYRRASAHREVVAAFCYATDKGDSGQRKFQNALRHIGFEVKLKPFIQRGDGSAKGDWDVGITLDAIEYAERADVIVLVSGDGDFDLLAEKIRRVHGKRVEVYGVAALTAASLMRAASEFVPIEGELLLS